MNSSRIAYAPRPDATPEGELNALASIYRFVLDSAHKNAAGRTSTNGDRGRAGCSVQLEGSGRRDP
jgi:hypothetical protein